MFGHTRLSVSQFKGGIERLFLGALACALGMTMAVSAAEVSPEMAARAAKNWRATRDTLACPLGTTVATSRTVTANSAKFNVVTFEGGGFVVTAADTTVRPIVFFSGDDDLDEDPRNPLFGLLKKDLAVSARAAADAATNAVALASVRPGSSTANSANEQAWAKLLADPDPKAVELASVSPSDIRVGPLLSSAWSQSTVSYWWKTKNVYNYYTPNNYVCGCVATAAAQIMRYFQWPKSDVSISQVTSPYCKVDGTDTTLTTQGGYYNWSDMPLSPSYSSITETQQQAIGKLCSDLGIVMGMNYSDDGSGTGTYCAGWAFVNVFKYTQAVNALWSSSDNKTSSSEQTRQALLTNFDAKLPVQIGMTDSDGESGHSIVADGYGYSNGSLCYHLNYGWAGSDNGWYCPPDLGNDYTIIDDLVYNIYTTQDANNVIVSGRLLGTSGSAASGVTVEARQGTTTKSTATTDSNGIFALYVPQNATYTIRATQGTTLASTSATTKSIRSLKIVVANGVPTGSYYIGSWGNVDAPVCNVHVGDMQLVSTTPVAYMNSTPYYTFAEACAAATDGATVTLKQNVSETVTVTTPCTVDFGGYTLTGTMYVQNTSGTVTLKNGTITGASDSIDGKAGSSDTFPGGTVRFENMTTTGTIWSDSHPLVFTSGTYTGAVRSGSQVCTISGGSFANLVKDGTASYAISGGLFAADYSSISTWSSSYVWANASGNSTYPWTLVAYVEAAIGSTNYGSLAAAISAATAGQTVTLKANVSSAATVDKAITLDLAGYTVSGLLTVTGNATVKGGTATQVTASGSLTWAGGTADKLTVTGGTTTLVDGTLTDVTLTGTGAFTQQGGTVAKLTASGSGAITFKSGNVGALTLTGTSVATATSTDIHFGEKPSCAMTLPSGAVWVNTGTPAAYPWTLTTEVEAAIGSTFYMTLAEAIAAATDGQTITLRRNVYSSALIEKPLTLQLAGYTLSGELCVSNTVTVSGGTATKVLSYGNLTWQDGTLGELVVTNGTTVIAGGTVTTCRQLGSGKVQLNGGAVTTLDATGNAPSLLGGSIGTLTATGVSQLKIETNSVCAISSIVAERTRLILYAGTYPSVTASGSSGSYMFKNCTIDRLTVSNGPTVYVYAGVSVSSATLEGSTPLILTGGTVDELTLAGSGAVTLKSGNFGTIDLTGTSTITASSIDVHAAARPECAITVPSGSAWVRVGTPAAYPWTLTKEVEAAIGSTVYGTFAEAIAAATDGQTVTLRRDVSADSWWVTKPLTLNLGNFTAAGTLCISNVVTVSGGAVTKVIAYGDLTWTAGDLGELVVTNGTTLISGGTVTNCTQLGSGKVLLEGGAVTTLDVSGNAPSLLGGSVGTLTATGVSQLKIETNSVCEISSIVAERTRLILYAGTYQSVTASGSSGSYMFKNCSIGKLTVSNGPTVNVYAGVSVLAATLEGTTPLILTGGTVDALTLAGSGAVTLKSGNFGTIDLTGTSKVTASSIDVHAAERPECAITVPSGSAWVRAGTPAAYPWTLTKDIEAVIGSALYATVTDALSAATEGQTVTLRRNATRTAIVRTPLTLNLAGYTLSGLLRIATNNVTIAGAGGSARRVQAYGDLTWSNATAGNLTVTNGTVVIASGTVTNLTVKGSGSVTLQSGTVGSITQSENGKLQLEGGQVTSCDVTGNAPTLLGGSIGTLSVTDVSPQLKIETNSVCAISSLIVANTRLILYSGTYPSITASGSSGSYMFKNCTVQSLAVTNGPTVYVYAGARLVDAEMAGTTPFYLTGGAVENLTAAGTGAVTLKSGNVGAIDLTGTSVITVTGKGAHFATVPTCKVSLPGTTWRWGKDLTTGYPWYATKDDFIADANGVTYRNLLKALEAKAPSPYIPLVGDEVVIPKGMGVFSVTDTNAWLTLKWTNVRLFKTVSSGKTKTYWYGDGLTPAQGVALRNKITQICPTTAEQDALAAWINAHGDTLSGTDFAESKYVKASYLLNRPKLLTDEDVVTLANVVFANEAITFDLSLGGAKETAEAISQFVETSSDLTLWAPATVVTVDANGRVTVKPSGSPALVRIRLPQDQ